MVSKSYKRIYAFFQREAFIVSAILCGLIFIFPHSAFASQGLEDPAELPSKEEIYFSITEQLRYDELNLDETTPAEAVRATDYTQLIYNYLTGTMAPNQTAIYNELIGNSSYTDSIANTLKNLKTIFYGSSTSYPTHASSIYSILNNMNSNLGDNFYYQGLATLALYDTAKTESIYDVSKTISTVAGAISGNTSSISAYTYYNGTKLDTLHSDLSNINNQFTLSAGDFVGIFSDSFSGNTPILSPISRPSTYVNTGQTEVHALFNFVASSSSESVYSVFIPIRRASNDPIDYAFGINFCSPSYLTNYTSYLQPDIRDIQVVKYGVVITFSLVNTPISNYLLDIDISSRSGSYSLYYYGYTDPYFKYIPQSDSRFSDIYNYLINKYYLNNIAYDVDDLADYLVSPEKQAAEDASSQVINETLDDFTGSGSASAGVSDVVAMKNVSGGIKNGLNAGGSVSDALSIFNSNNSIWGWFSQSNYNDINNPSLQTRDYIPDFYSDNLNLLRILHIED